MEAGGSFPRAKKMPPLTPEVDVGQLSVPQRLELIARLWDSIPDSLEGVPVPQWHEQELKRRLAAANENPEAAIPWDEAKARLRQKP